jgi:hypothetical protein
LAQSSQAGLVAETPMILPQRAERLATKVPMLRPMVSIYVRPVVVVVVPVRALMAVLAERRPVVHLAEAGRDYLPETAAMGKPVATVTAS